MASTFDIVVIGSGPGGYRAAIFAGLQGKKVAIVEKQQWGGCCLNRGCVPKKTWHHTAKLVQQSRSFTRRGIHGAIWADIQAAWRHQQEIVATIRDSYLNYLKRLGVKRVDGVASLDDPNTVIVTDAKGGTSKLKTRNVIIATGASANIPNGFGVVPNRIITTDDLFDSPPPLGDRVGILGSGVVASEFAFILQQFGFKVTWFATNPPLEKSLFSATSKEYLRKKLKTLDLSPVVIKSPLTAETEGHHVAIKQGNKTLAEIDWVLLATGRKPNTDGLNLSKLSIETDDAQFIKRNSYLQTTCENIYAIGDCANPLMTANNAIAEATTAVQNIIHDNKREHAGSAVPHVVYSAVELARVGIDENQAEDSGIETALGFTSFETSPTAMGQDDDDGFVRIIADADQLRLVGGEIVGQTASELIHLLVPTLGQPIDLQSLLTRFYNHPARAEELLNATETMAAKWKLFDLFNLK